MSPPLTHAPARDSTPTEVDYFAAREFWENEWNDSPGSWPKLGRDEQETIARSFARHRERQLGVGRDGVQLHEESVGLVERFARALAGKLAAAEAKYGRTTDWQTQDWEGEARQKLLEHVAKGDPLDVAAYAAFIWARGWRTANPAVTIDVVGPDDMVEAIRIIGGLLDCGFQPTIVQRTRRWLERADAGQLGEPLYGLALSLAQDLGELIEQSEGVIGLHQNGDPAPWGELLRGGRFEDWLSSFDRLRDHLDGGAGRCRICGCTDDHACDPPCSWANEARTLCTAPACLEAAAGDDEGCPKGDPECLSGDGDCHDACEAPDAAVERITEEVRHMRRPRLGPGYAPDAGGRPVHVGVARTCCATVKGDEHDSTCRSQEAAYFRVNGNFADGDGPCTYHGQPVDPAVWAKPEVRKLDTGSAEAGGQRGFPDAGYGRDS